MSAQIAGSKIVEVKQTVTVPVTVEGNKMERSAQLDFMLICPATVEELAESLNDASEEAKSYFFAMLASNMETRACYKAGRYMVADEPLEVPKEIGLDWAFGLIETGRFSFRKAAEQARKEALELPGLLAAGKLDLAEFLARHAELTSKAAEMDAKADEQAAERKPRTKKVKTEERKDVADN